MAIDSHGHGCTRWESSNGREESVACDVHGLNRCSESHPAGLYSMFLGLSQRDRRDTNEKRMKKLLQICENAGLWLARKDVGGNGCNSENADSYWH